MASCASANVESEVKVNTRRSRIGVVVLGAMLLACDGPTGPSPAWQSGADYLLTTIRDGDQTQLALVDPEAGTVRPLFSVGGYIEDFIVSADGEEAYVGSVDDAGSREMTALALPGGRRSWQFDLAKLWHPQFTSAGVSLMSAEVLAMSPATQTLYASQAMRGDTFGIAALDLRTRTVVAFSGPWHVSVGGIIPLPAGSGADRGRILIVARHQSGYDGPRLPESLYLLDPGSLVPVDSISTAELGFPNTNILRVVLAPGGRYCYVRLYGAVVKWDFHQRRVVAAAQAQGLGALTVTPDGSALVSTDGGTWPDFPGSGTLVVYDPNLHIRGIIDVSTPLGGQPSSALATPTGGATAGRDGHTVYVTSGSPPEGLYPTQPSRLLVIDVDQMKLIRTIPLPGSGLSWSLRINR